MAAGIGKHIGYVPKTDRMWALLQRSNMSIAANHSNPALQRSAMSENCPNFKIV